MDGFGFPPYVSVAERLRRGKKQLARLLTREGRAAEPVALEGRRAIATTFWARAWCENLERYSDFASRLPRGRTYARNGSVLDLRVLPGRIAAHVAGHDLYQVDLAIEALAPRRWKRLVGACAGRIGSVVALLQGELSDEVMAVLTAAEGGLFPEPDEIALSCSCPDVAGMCKHIAASLYAVGARLDARPDLFFVLRRVDQADLVASAAAPVLPRRTAPGKKIIPRQALSKVFGIELEAARRGKKR